MLIINADDFGRSREATDKALSLYREALITSASAMVFMQDSRRAADLAASVGLETGLHLNLSEPFDAPFLPERLREAHRRIVGYYRSGRWAAWLYNPFVRRPLDYIFKAQYDEYSRLFGAAPSKLDGHHHLHLSLNIIVDNLIPRGLSVRRNHSFAPGEKDVFNRAYRGILDAWLVRRFSCSDAFFSVKPHHDLGRLRRIVRMAHSRDIELMTHPDDAAEYRFLMGSQYRELIGGVPRGTFRSIASRPK